MSLQFHVKLIGHTIGNHIDTNQKLMHRLVHGDFDKDKGSVGLRRFHCKSKEHMPLSFLFVCLVVPRLLLVFPRFCCFFFLSFCVFTANYSMFFVVLIVCVFWF